MLFVFLWQVSRLAKLRVDISMRPSFRLILNGKYVRPNKNAQLDCFKRRWAGTYHAIASKDKMYNTLLLV